MIIPAHIDNELIEFIHLEINQASLLPEGIWIHPCYAHQPEPGFIPGSQSIDKKKEGFAVLWRDILDIPALNLIQKAVLCRVISSAERSGIVSNQDIADGLGIHRDTVNEALTALEDRRLIRTNGRRGYGRRFETVFTPPTFSREIVGSSVYPSKTETPSSSIKRETQKGDFCNELDGTSRHNSISTFSTYTVEGQNQTQPVTEPRASASEGTETQTSVNQDHRFDGIWKLYNKGSQSKAREAWNKLEPDQRDLVEMEVKSLKTRPNTEKRSISGCWSAKELNQSSGFKPSRLPLSRG